MQKTWKPVTAGILNIVSGAVGVIFGIFLILRARHFERIIPHLGRDVVGLTWIILAIFAVAGGIAALQRKNWGTALAGAICAIFTPGFLMGVLATVFLSISKNEFGAPNPS
jgi:hypothetical protein